MSKILVTGGSGYIGSHTLVDLLEHGFDVVSIDNFSRSSPEALEGVTKITGKTFKNYAIDLCDLPAVQAVFKEQSDIAGIIHFAAYKTVPESVEHPLRYFHNNLNSLLNILHCMEEFKVQNLVFSSSCSVYGNATELPVTENTPWAEAESPYGRTKQIGEKMINDFVIANPNTNNILLRYFNPVGAHESAHIGEYSLGTPNNLVPYITQTAIGKREKLTVFGGDYETRDGSCIRDYIHVMDIARAHTQAIEYVLSNKNSTNLEVFNLGSGEGVSVLEVIAAFEKASGVKLNYQMGPRRAGDVVAVYADRTKATNKLNWNPQRTIDEMMLSAWNWEQQLASKN